MAKTGPHGRKFRNIRESGNLRTSKAPADNPVRCREWIVPAALRLTRTLGTAIFGVSLILLGSIASLPQARADASEWWALGTFLQPLNNAGDQTTKAGSTDFYHKVKKSEELSRAGRNLEALKVLDGLAAAYPKRVEVFWRRAALHMFMQSHRRALADFGVVAKLSPDAVGAHLKRGQLLAKTNRDGEALRAYREAISAAKRRYAAIAEYWKAYATSNEAPALVETTLALLRRDRDKTIADAHLGQGQVHFARSRYEAAQKAYSDAIAAMPDYELAYRYRGWLNEKTGQIRSARADYRRALEIDATDAWTQKALQRVR